MFFVVVVVGINSIWSVWLPGKQLTASESVAGSSYHQAQNDPVADSTGPAIPSRTTQSRNTAQSSPARRGERWMDAKIDPSRMAATLQVLYSERIHRTFLFGT